MNNNVRELVKEILSNKISNINGLLFWDNKKDTYITPYEINAYLKRINVKYDIVKGSIHSHRLRHTFVTRCVEKGINFKVIQSLVGHVIGSNITSEVYTSVSNDFILQEIEKMN